MFNTYRPREGQSVTFGLTGYIDAVVETRPDGRVVSILKTDGPSYEIITGPDGELVSARVYGEASPNGDVSPEWKKYLFRQLEQA